MANLKQGRQLTYSATLAFTELLLIFTAFRENGKIILDQIRMGFKSFICKDSCLEFMFLMPAFLFIF